MDWSFRQRIAHDSCSLLKSYPRVDSPLARLTCVQRTLRRCTGYVYPVLMGNWMTIVVGVVFNVHHRDVPSFLPLQEFSPLNLDPLRGAICPGCNFIVRR